MQAGLCALALLDPASDGFAAELDLVKATAGRWARQPLRFSWINAARQARAALNPSHGKLGAQAAHASAVVAVVSLRSTGAWR